MSTDSQPSIAKQKACGRASHCWRNLKSVVQRRWLCNAMTKSKPSSASDWIDSTPLTNSYKHISRGKYHLSQVLLYFHKQCPEFNKKSWDTKQIISPLPRNKEINKTKGDLDDRINIRDFKTIIINTLRKNLMQKMDNMHEVLIMTFPDLGTGWRLCSVWKIQQGEYLLYIHFSICILYFDF